MAGLRGCDGAAEGVAVVSADAETERLLGGAPSAGGKKAPLPSLGCG